MTMRLSYLRREGRPSRVLVFLSVVVSLLAFSLSAGFAGQSLSARDFQALDAYQARLVESSVPGVDTRVAIARNFLKVRNGIMSGETFYKQLGRLPMFDNKEPRHALMLVKRDIGEFFGTSEESFGQEFFFGRRLETTTKDGRKVGGSTEVERAILTERRKIVFDAVERVLRDFAGRNIKGNKKYSVYLAEIGGWAKELPQEMKLAGDIDFSFLCGDVEIAMALKQAYDSYIFSRYGMTPEQMDIPATAHGKGTYEVYVHRHGQAFAEKSLSNVRRINLNRQASGSRIGELVNGKHALTDVLLEAKFSDTPLLNLVELKWPTEPGISLEMIRHFEHDIVHKDVYSDVESFIKAAKYTERSMKSLAEAGIHGVDEDLSKVTNLLVESKTAPPDTIANIIRNYFTKKGIRFPYEIDLTPSRTGHGPATLKANRLAVHQFWDICRTAMWKNAELGFSIKISELQARVATMDPTKITPQSDLAVEMKQMWEMMEVQDRVMRRQDVGVKRIPESFEREMRSFRTVHNDFLKRAQGRAHGPDAETTYRAVRELSEAANASRSQNTLLLAAGVILKTAGDINRRIDFIDNVLLDDVKKGTRDLDWYQALKESHEVSWSQKVNDFVGIDRVRIGGDLQRSMDNLHEQFKQVEIRVNTKLLDNCMARGIRGINQSFQRSVDASLAGTYMIQGLILVNLASELPLYANLIADGNWQEFGAQFFVRRVPGGMAVENYIMGDYFAATWSLVKTFVPPAALFETSAKIGRFVGEKSWEISWQEELQEFIDSLYENAEFTLLGLEKVGEDIRLTNWRLESVTYRGETVNMLDFIAKKEAQIREMQQYLAMKESFRYDQATRPPDPFPMDYTLGGITGWFRFNDALRVNIGKNDPFLVYYDSIRKSEIAGPLLQEFFSDLWYTRWEQVKLEFVKEMKIQLEKRRSAEAAQLSGQVPKMYEELMQIADELMIKDEVVAALEEEVGSEFVQFVISLGDYLRGVKRHIRGEAAVWGVYEKNAKVIKNYLRVYAHIHKHRTEAEKRLTGGPQIDHGLRFLTGKYFLTGRASRDEEDYFRWAKLPLETEVIMEEKVRRAVEACQTREEERTAAQAGIDPEILKQLVYHQVFKESWKNVYDHPEARGRQHWLTTIARGYIDSQSRTQRDADQVWGFLTGDSQKTDQDLALELFKFHHEQIESLLHLVCADDALTELRALRDQCEELSGLICTAGAGLVADLEAARQAIEGANQTFTQVEPRIRQIMRVVDRLDSIINGLNRDHQSAEGLAVEIGDAAVFLQGRQEDVCAIASVMHDARTNRERDVFYQEATAAYADIQPGFNRARSDFSKLEGINARAKETLDTLTTARQNLDPVTRLPAEIEAARQAVDAGVAAAEAQQQVLEGRLEELSGLVAEAKTMAGQIRNELRSERRTPEGRELLAELSQISREIDRSLSVARDCVRGPVTDFQRSQSVLSRFDTRYRQLQNNIDKIRRAFIGEGGRRDPLPVDVALEKTHLIDLLASMGQGYTESCAQAMLVARNCLNNAEQLSRIDVSAVVPDVVGMLCREGGGVMAGLGIRTYTFSKGQAVHPDLEYRIAGTDPAAGIEVTLKEEGVVLACYEDLNIPAFLATVDCSHIEGSTAVYDREGRRGVCDCVRGLVFNPSRTRCIDCRQYYSGFQTALQGGDLSTAQLWIDEGRACNWSAHAQAALNAERQRIACAQMEMALRTASQQNNAGWASSILTDARQWNCALNPQLVQHAIAMINRHNEQARQQQRQTRQEQMQQFINVWSEAMEQISGGGSSQPSRGAPSQTPRTGQTGSGVSPSGSTGSSGGATQDRGGSDCVGGLDLLGICAQ